MSKKSICDICGKEIKEDDGVVHHFAGTDGKDDWINEYFHEECFDKKESEENE